MIWAGPSKKVGWCKTLREALDKLVWKPIFLWLLVLWWKREGKLGGTLGESLEESCGEVVLVVLCFRFF